MDGWVSGWVNGWVDGCVDGWTSGWMDGWVSECKGEGVVGMTIWKSFPKVWLLESKDAVECGSSMSPFSFFYI